MYGREFFSVNIADVLITELNGIFQGANLQLGVMLSELKTVIIVLKVTIQETFIHKLVIKDVNEGFRDKESYPAVLFQRISCFYSSKDWICCCFELISNGL